jgi:hypothetical protein
MAEHDLVDVLDAETGVGDRLARDLPDQGFDVVLLVPAEGRMAPADDTGGHQGLLFAPSVMSPTSAGQPVRRPPSDI